MRNKLILFTIFILLLSMATVQALPPNLQKTLQRAKSYSAGGDHQSALDLLNPIVEKYPADLQLLQVVYGIYVDMKDYDNALKYLQQIRSVGSAIWRGIY